MDFDLAQGVAVLERTPRVVLRALLAGLPPAWTDATEGPDTEPVHCRGAPHPWYVAAGDTGRGATISRGRESQGTPLPELLDEFARRRAENLATLKGWTVTDHDLSLEGEHPEFGAVTLRQLLATWVAHDLAHLGQISREMAKQYREAVGPWRRYLGRLKR